MKRVIVLLFFFIEVINVNAKTFNVGFALDDVNERWLKEEKVIKSQVLKHKGSFTVTTALGNHQTQFNQVKELVETKKINVLIIVAVDGNKAGAIVDYAKSKGVKVIAYSRMINNCDLDYFVAFNGSAIGVQQAEYAINKKKGNYVIIGGPSKDLNTPLLKSGHYVLLDELIKKREVNVLAERYLTTWSKEEAYQTMKAIHEKFEDSTIHAVIAANDLIAEGAIKYLKEQKIEGVIVTGLDAELEACRRIVKGDQSMTIYMNFPLLATYASEIAYQLAMHKGVTSQLKNVRTTTVFNGKKKVDSLFLDSELVTKENLTEVLTRHKLHSREQVYK